LLTSIIMCWKPKALVWCKSWKEETKKIIWKNLYICQHCPFKLNYKWPFISCCPLFPKQLK
jgi:hypothetical protein